MDAIKTECEQAGDVEPENFHECKEILEKVGHTYDKLKQELSKLQMFSFWLQTCILVIVAN